MAKIVIPLKGVLLAKHEKWSRVKILVENDERGFETKEFCLKLPNETRKAYEYRKSVYTVGFVNPAIELLTAPSNTIYRNEIKEELGVKDSRLNLFVENVVKGGENEITLTQYMKEAVCPHLRGYGTIFLVMDMPRIEGAVTEEAQKENRVWPYLSMIHPLDVLNYQYENGELLWFAYSVTHRDTWTDPMEKEPKEEKETRIWTKTQFFRIDKDGSIIEDMAHGWGFVPVIIQASFKSEPGNILGESPFITSSRYIITANNHLNTINIELWKYSNSLLLINKDALCAANSNTTNTGEYTLKTIPDGSAFIWSGEKVPDYLIRDLAVIEPTLAQYNLYMDSTIDNERSAKSVAKSGYSGSEAVKAGIALLIERDPILANIVATALDCEAVHRRTVVMADKMINDGVAKANPVVEYDKNYDIRPFKDRLANIKTIVNELKVPSETLIKEEFKKVADNEIKDKKLRKKVYSEIDSADVGEQVISDKELEKILTPGNKKVAPVE